MKPSMATKPSHFHWSTNKVTNLDNNTNNVEQQQQKQQLPSKENATELTKPQKSNLSKSDKIAAQRRKLQTIAVSRFRSVVTVFTNRRSSFPSRVTGTLFGRRRGHVHFALQKDPTSEPSFLVELATPISGLVREMASGLVRIALECDKTESGRRLTDEVRWRAYCNGKRCGFASRKVYGEKEKKLMKAVEMVSMGAGVLPGGGESDDGKSKDEDDDEVMYMRARFERVVGDRDSEAFYMMNPDSNGAPELSIYLLRI